MNQTFYTENINTPNVYDGSTFIARIALNMPIFRLLSAKFFESLLIIHFCSQNYDKNTILSCKTPGKPIFLSTLIFNPMSTGSF